jgi:DNA-directed RNA polymerase specialized sigma24 family protein
MTDSKTAPTFTDFYRDVEPRLRRALVAAFGVDIGAESTAEALAFGWEHWERVSQMPNPAGYLFGVGRNKARRHRSRRVVFPVPPVGHEFEVEPGIPKALSRLSDKQRVAVLLVYGDEWTWPEVADLLDVSVSTVQKHLERGMSKLRHSIGVEL